MILDRGIQKWRSRRAKFSLRAPAELKMTKGVQKEYKSVRKSVRKCTKCTYESVHWNTNRNDYQASYDVDNDD